MTNDQRMVDVGLLWDSIAALVNPEASLEQKETCADKLRTIISGPGVEPVAPTDDAFTEGELNSIQRVLFDNCGPATAKKVRAMIAAPSAPVQDGPDFCDGPVSEGFHPDTPYNKQFPQAPVQAVPDAIHDCLFNKLASLESATRTINSRSAEPVKDWKLVPMTPTPEMLDAAYFHAGTPDMKSKGAYSAMLAAAPQPPKEIGE